MDSAFDEIASLLDDSTGILERYDESMEKLNQAIYKIIPTPVANVRNAKGPKVTQKRTKPIRIAENLLDEAIREIASEECLFGGSEILSTLENTTNTLEGLLSNVTFHEADLIKKCHYTDNIVRISCNYGEVVNPYYHAPVVTKTTRGRKKKEKAPKTRKEQGSGTEFNSQITLAILPYGKGVTEATGNAITYDKVYKFKIFRPGQIQLPGARMDNLEDIIGCSQIMVKYLNEILGKTDIHLQQISAVMKNYKFLLGMSKGTVLDLTRLKEIIYTKNNICMVKYSRQDSKLAIIFNTPTANDPDKTARVNIFTKGKINILGAFESKHTITICETLQSVFSEYYDELVCYENDTTRCWTRNINLPNWDYTKPPSIEVPLDVMAIIEAALKERELTCTHACDWMLEWLDK